VKIAKSYMHVGMIMPARTTWWPGWPGENRVRLLFALIARRNNLSHRDVTPWHGNVAGGGGGAFLPAVSRCLDESGHEIIVGTSDASRFEVLTDKLLKNIRETADFTSPVRGGGLGKARDTQPGLEITPDGNRLSAGGNPFRQPAAPPLEFAAPNGRYTCWTDESWGPRHIRPKGGLRPVPALASQMSIPSKPMR